MCYFALVHLHMLIHSITPIPLFSGNFNGQAGFSYQVVECVYLRKGRQRNQSNNNRRQNCPYQFQRSVVVKTLGYHLYSVVKTLYNTRPQPQTQNQDHNLKKANIRVLIHNSFHVGSRWVLKQLLPRHRSIGSNNTPIPYHTQHRTHIFISILNRRYEHRVGRCLYEVSFLLWLNDIHIFLFSSTKNLLLCFELECSR